MSRNCVKASRTTFNTTTPSALIRVLSTDPDDEICQNRCMMKKNRKLLASYAKNDYFCSTQGMDDGDTLHCCSTCGMHVSFA